jgi:DNA polymerase (family 10)
MLLGKGNLNQGAAMPVHNAEIAELFNRYAELLEIQDANPFRVRAYRNAARTVDGLGRELEQLVADGEDLKELPGIGEDLAAKIREILKTGHLKALEELEHGLPEHLADLATIPGLGPKRIRALHRQLGIGSLEDLERACRKGRLQKLDGFGKKTEEKILRAIEQHRDTEKRVRLVAAEQVAEPLLAYLKESRGVEQAIIAGSYRRRRETVGDLDILITAPRDSDVMARFTGYDEVAEVVSQGDTRATVILRSGLQVDLRVVPDESYGAALHYFTGSKAHNIAVRGIAQRKGLKVNEYGVFRDNRQVAGRTEESVFAQADLPYIEPELRENRGEIEAARTKRLPRLIELKAVRGDLHCHTDATDGHNTAEEMALAAKERGYEYIAISDHTQHVTIANGMDADRFARHLDELEKLNERLKGITVLKSAEVDILDDGSLDLPHEILKRLDFTVCAIHYKFDLPEKQQTERILRAMDSPYFNIFAHPTGRLIGEREPYAVDMERIMSAAMDRGCALEINAQPSRMDLSDTHIKLARDLGVKLVIATDAHSTAHLDYMRLGVDQARRGWLEAGDVLNTRGLKGLLKGLRRA